MTRIASAFLADRNAQLLQPGSQSGAYKGGVRPVADLRAGTPALLAKEVLARKQLRLRQTGSSGSLPPYVRARSELTASRAAIGSDYAAIFYTGSDHYFWSSNPSDETAESTQRMATFVKVESRWLLESFEPVIAKPLDTPLNEPLS